MKTLVLSKPGAFELVEREGPGEVPAGHALVRTRRVGICGTDWHAFHGRQPFFSYPRVLGHELGVEVEKVNAEGSGVKVGDKCSVEPYLNCGSCLPCRRGRENCCVNLKVLGVHADGGMCERFVVPVGKLHVSKTLTLDQLALVETLGIGCHAVNRARIEKGENVLILGAGPIGLSVLPFVQAAGGRAIVADVSEGRLAFARDQMRADRTLNAGRDLVEGPKGMLGGELPSVVFDATGNSGSMAKTFELVVNSGTIVFVGLFQGEVTFNDPNFHRREITLMASRNALPADFTRIIRLIEDGVIDTTPWITHRAKVEEFVGTYSGWLAPEQKLLKAVVEF